MATFTKETSLYEILIRVLPDGLWAAHYQTITEVKEDGVTFGTPTIDSVLPLNSEDSAAFAILQELMGDTASKNIVLNGRLQATVAGLQEEIEALKEALALLQPPKVEAE